MLKQDAKKSWLKFISFCVMTVLFFWVVQTLFFTNDVAWARKQFYRQLEEKYQVIYMGNSHSFTTFSPEIIDAIVGVDSYSLGTSEQLIDQTYYELQQLLKYQQPDLIIVEANAIVPNIKEELVTTFGSEQVFSTYIRTIVKTKLPIIDNHSAWKMPEKLFKNMNHLFHYLSAGKATGVDEAGYHPLQHVALDQIELGEVDKKPVSISNISSINQYYLEEFRSLCDENGIKFIVFKTPQLLASEYDLQFNENSANPFQYYDLNLQSQDLNWLHFQDTGHLSTFGSLIASVNTAKIISEEMNLPIDQTAMNYFQSYYFDSFDLSSSGDKVRLTLYPVDLGRSSALKYKWQVLKNEEIVLDMDYQVNNYVDFVKGLPGDQYSIRVWINDPAGDYVLEGIFSYIINLLNLLGRVVKAGRSLSI